MSELYGYQSYDVNEHWWKKNNGRAILGWSVGTGKTFTGAYITQVALEKRFVESVLIVCPPTIVETWRDELTARNLEFSLFTSRKKEYGKITITTYDMLKKFDTPENFLLIADECHKIKNSTSKRGKVFRKIANKAKYLLLMSGTLSQHRDAEEYLNYLWSIDVNGLPDNITQYRKKYSRYVGRGMIKFPVSTKEGATLIDKHMQYLTSFRNLRDIHDIPDYHEYTVKCGKGLDFVKIAQAILDKYKMVEVDVIGRENRPSVIHALMAANGINPLTYEVEDNAKIDTTLEYIEQFGNEKVIVWVWWQAFGEELKRRLGDKAVLVNGHTPDKQKTENIEKFRGDTRILIASLGSIAEGINLQFCHNAIIANQWYDIVKETQSRGRIERIGQKNKMVVIRVVARGTIEQQVVQVLKQKKNLQQAQQFLEGVLSKRYGL